MYTTPMRVFDNKYSIVLWVIYGFVVVSASERE